MLCRGSHSVPVPWGTEVCKPQLSMASIPVLLKSNRSSWDFPGTQLSVTEGPLIPWGWSLHAWHTLSIPAGRRPAGRHWGVRAETDLQGEEEKVKVLVAQLCLTLCNPMDCSLPGSSVHGILQARILKWFAIPFSRGSSWPRDETWLSCTAVLQADSYHLRLQESIVQIIRKLFTLIKAIQCLCVNFCLCTHT